MNWSFSLSLRCTWYICCVSSIQSWRCIFALPPADPAIVVVFWLPSPCSAVRPHRGRKLSLSSSSFSPFTVFKWISRISLSLAEKIEYSALCKPNCMGNNNTVVSQKSRSYPAEAAAHTRKNVYLFNRPLIKGTRDPNIYSSAIVSSAINMSTGQVWTWCQSWQRFGSNKQLQSIISNAFDRTFLNDPTFIYAKNILSAQYMALHVG